MAVIFAFALTGLGQVAHAVSAAAENLPTSRGVFELSQDGETVWDDTASYAFVGFGEDGDYSTAFGDEQVSVGRKLGKLRGEPGWQVRQLRASGGEYIVLQSRADTSEVFKRFA